MKKEYDFSKAKRGAAVPQKGKTRISIYIDNDVLEQGIIRTPTLLSVSPCMRHLCDTPKKKAGFGE